MLAPTVTVWLRVGGGVPDAPGQKSAPNHPSVTFGDTAYAAGPSVAARHLPTLWGVTPQGEPLGLHVGGRCLHRPENKRLPGRADDEHRPLQNG